MTCPSCGAETSKLIGCNKLQRVVCTLCHENCQGAKRPINTNLGQTLFYDGMTRVTTGKAWEINRRIKSPDDNRTIINRVTGKPAQY